MSRFARLFALAKQLEISKDDLSAGAESFTGVASLKSLNWQQQKTYEDTLQRQVNAIKRNKKAWLMQNMESGDATQIQRNMLADLIITVFDGDLSKFDSWLKNYFELERHQLDPFLLKGPLVALTKMRDRRFRT